MNHQERLDRRIQIAEDVKNGLSIKDACTKYGVSMATVRSACWAQFGSPPRQPRKVNPQKPCQFVILFSLLQGESVRDTAERLGVSAAWVHEVAAQAERAGFRFPYRNYAG